jgi:anti-sigma regulatory factor (Ser/Thr protein kinase)
MVALELPVASSSVAAARRLLRTCLVGCDEGFGEAAALMTSELVTNAVRHSRRHLSLAIHLSRHQVRVEVSDDSTDPPRMQSPDQEDTTGRGLLIVHTLADRWGFEATTTGKTVWFELSQP